MVSEHPTPRVLVSYHPRLSLPDPNQPIPRVSPLLRLRGHVTHLIISTLYVTEVANPLAFNDIPVNSSRLTHLHHLLEPFHCRSQPTPILVKLGGQHKANFTATSAKDRTFSLLRDHFPVCWPPLRAFIHEFKLSGVVLDVQERKVTHLAIAHLTRELKHEFGPQFLVARVVNAEDLGWRIKHTPQSQRHHQPDMASPSGTIARCNDLNILSLEHDLAEHGSSIDFYIVRYSCPTDNAPPGYEDAPALHLNSYSDMLVSDDKQTTLPSRKLLAGVHPPCIDRSQMAEVVTPSLRHTKDVVESITQWYGADFGGIVGWAERPLNDVSEADEEEIENGLVIWAREMRSSIEAMLKKHPHNSRE